MREPKETAGARPGLVARVTPGLATIRSQGRRSLRTDSIAALSLWAVLVPQALAYSDLAGLAPALGLYTAFAGMIAYAIFGTSRYLNVGPESSVAIVIAASLTPLAAEDPARYAALAAVLALMVGGFMLLGYLLRAGIVTRLLSAPVLTGYLAGAAFVIISNQLPKLFDIKLEGTTTFAIVELVPKLDRANWTAFAIGIGAAALMLLIDRFASRLPAALIVLVLATLTVVALGLDEEQDVSTVGRVRAGLPTITSFGGVDASDVGDLAVPAASIALLVFVSSVATARTLAARDREDLDANREFVGFAVANVGAGLLSGFPANGSDSRSFVIANSGGRTQITGLVGAGLIVITLFALTPIIRYIPTSALAGIVVVTALSLIDPAELRSLWQTRRVDFVLAVATLASVLVFGVLAGIAIGVLASLIEVMRRAIAPHRAVLGFVPGELPTFRDIENYAEAEVQPGLVVYRFDAPIFFANADAFRDDVLRLVHEAKAPVRTFVVNAEAIYDVDTTGVRMLSRLLDDLEPSGVRFAMARVRTSVRDMLRRTGLEERIGPDGFYLTVVEAATAFDADRPSNPGMEP
jgi:sulfate permease, SulP family